MGFLISILIKHTAMACLSFISQKNRFFFFNLDLFSPTQKKHAQQFTCSLAYAFLFRAADHGIWVDVCSTLLQIHLKAGVKLGCWASLLVSSASLMVLVTGVVGGARSVSLKSQWGLCV